MRNLILAISMLLVGCAGSHATHRQTTAGRHVSPEPKKKAIAREESPVRRSRARRMTLAKNDHLAKSEHQAVVAKTTHAAPKPQTQHAAKTAPSPRTEKVLLAKNQHAEPKSETHEPPF